MSKYPHFLPCCLLLLGLLGINSSAQAAVYTTVANGDWASPATWSGGVVPDNNLTGDTVTINNRVSFPESLGSLLINNGTLTVNKILILNNSNLEMGDPNGVVNLSNGLVILNNQSFNNDAGNVNFTNGAVQLCNGNYSVRNSAHSNGNGNIFSKIGNIERFGSGTFNNLINWCADTGIGTGLPSAENCAAARPPAGDCQNESNFINLNPSVKKWATDINLYKVYAGKMDYAVIGNSELTETGGRNNCKKSDSTSATLTLPAGVTVKAAYLYWYTMEKNDQDSPALVATADSIPATFLTTPLTINASRSVSSAIEFPANSGAYIRYGGRFADVTPLLEANPNGSYTVDVKGGTSEKACPLAEENARAWSLVVVYENPALTAANRIYVYDGMVGFVHSNVTVPVTGYRIPALRPDGKMTVVSVQGDPGLSGEFMNTSDTTFPNYPADFANSSSGAALDIDDLTGKFTAGSTNMNLEAGSQGDVIQLTNIVVSAPSEMDLSDGLASYGNAVHGIPLDASTLYLGTTPPDDDVGGQNTAAADWDDTHGTDDEGGVAIPNIELERNQTYTLPIGVTGTGFLSVWIDWNQDGDFDDADEQIASGKSMSTGTANLSVIVPTTATGGNHTVRARVCSAASECNTPSGFANDGEAEDYGNLQVKNCTSRTVGDVSEVAPAVPPQLGSDSKIFVASRSRPPAPAEGHLKALGLSSDDTFTAALWDAGTLMDATNRTSNLFSTDTTLNPILFNNLDDAAFSSTLPSVATIKAYTINPSFGGGAYLEGRKSGSFLGSISRGDSTALVTSAINQSRYLDDANYRTFYDGTVATRNELVLVTSDDGFLYAFNQSNGGLSWGWMPRSLVGELKNYKRLAFQSKLLMRGKIEVIDAKDSSGYATYVVGSYKNGLGHYVLKLSSTAGLSDVIWDEDRSTSFFTSPNRGDMGFFSDLNGNTFAAYVLTNGSDKSTLVIRNLLTTDSTEVPLNFNATSTPFIMPDFGETDAPARKTLYLGDNNGNIHRVSLLANGALDSVANLQTGLQNTTYSGDLGTNEPIRFLGAAMGKLDQKFYLRAQSDSRITVLKYNPATTNWLKQWTSFVGGAGKWDDTGTTFTADNSGVPTDLDGDGNLDPIPGGIQSLPNGSRITDSALIVANAVVLPVSVPINGKCEGNAYLNLYDLPKGIFPKGVFAAGSTAVVTNYYLGAGDPAKASMGDMSGQDKMKIISNSDQSLDNTTTPTKALSTPDPVSTGVRGWQEIGRE